ncbi:flagellar export chaperone FliS [Motilimonas sp. 1_MG-2023]|uniref:flagellar export chaperone FliS n=1 Tax=Motilimonas TaxID=1914248 RepID=UPI0026E21827|nr:flagellar export chaperone FliS [Motilimonas sp. 1_MG-2023]MDO6524956.1 flagellar export chaperone FliS [Motilimonas sp. 1_MG-2023]
MRANIKAYQNTNHQSSLLAADPHRVILMLMQGVVDTLAVAKGCILRKDFEGKSKSLNKAIGIIAGLQDGIDMKQSPEIGENFYQLYDYMIRRLGEASADQSGQQIDEVVSLISPIKEAWEGISEADKAKAEQMRAAQNSTA